MPAHRLFPKGSIVYALLSSSTYPNVLIPVKGIVKDVKYDEINPEYLIKVTKFYDSAKFLKKYFLGMAFSNKIGNRSKRFKIDKTKFKTVGDLEKFVNTGDTRFYIVVDSILCVKFKGELTQLFTKIQNHLIEVKLRDLRTYMTRPTYKGMYKLDTKEEFNVRLKRFIGDKIDKSTISFKKYIKIL